jgi:hypothetical protein
MIGKKIDMSHPNPEKDLGEITIVDMNELFDKVVFAVDGSENMTKENIELLGWKLVPDRCMSENNGFLFYGPKNWVLRFWTVAPRFELSFKNSVAFDSAKANPDSFGPGKQISIGLLKEKMIAFSIQAPSIWMSHQDYLIEKEHMDKKTSELIQQKTGWLK